jgi:uncharacterized protein involved in exopolysaccharide biosynthesis/Mrp family chromosome partitioning ATPase
MLLLAGVAWAFASTRVPRYAATSALTLNVGKVKIVDYEVVSRLPLEISTVRSEIDVIRSRSLNDEVGVKLGLLTDPAVVREAGAWLWPWQDAANRARRALRRFFPAIIEETIPDWSEPLPTLTQTEITDWLIGNLSVSNDNRSLTLVVSFISENPDVAAHIANAVAQTYLDDQALVKTRATMAASDWLGQRVSKIRKDLEKSEAAVDEYRRKAGLLPVRGDTIPADRLGDLNAQLSNARLERMRAEVKLQTARESGPENLPDVIASQMIQVLRKELLQINSEMAAEGPYSTFYKLKALQERGAVVLKQMNQEMNRILGALANEVGVARKKESQLAQSFQEIESQMGDAAHSNLQLIQLQREADANRSIYETFLARYKQAMEQESLAMPDARLISRAVPPENPVYPNKLRFLLIGIIGGLAVGGGLAFLREGFDRRVRQASDIESITGVPVYGFLPKVSRWRGLLPQDYPVADPHSRFCTALARIHTALGGPRRSDRNQVILVTSAQPGDGKTSFCTGLARSLAKNRMRVLVIDADPYRSQVPVAFGASSNQAEDGIAEQPSPLRDLVRADPKSSAHFMPAPNRDDLQFLLHSGRFAALIDEARKVYDAIIIDTPPVMTSADAALIGRFVDTCLLLVRWGRTSWDQMTAAVGFLRLCRVGLDGIVMVGADTGSAGYSALTAYDAATSDRRFMRISGTGASPTPSDRERH